jgi:hypothetical protein
MAKPVQDAPARDGDRTMLPAFHREATIDKSTVNAQERTFDITWSAGAEVPRIDWMTGARYIEVLQVDAKSIRLDRLESGRAPVLDSHNRYTLDNVIGVVVEGSVSFKDGNAKATVRMSGREDVAGIVGDVADGIIANVSPGYIVHAYREEVKDGLTYRFVTDWEPIEISFVPVGADPDAGLARGAGNGKPGETTTYPCIVMRAAGIAGQGTITPEIIERAKARMRMRAAAARV